MSGTDAPWLAWGISETGPLHTKMGLPNQDFMVIRRFSWGDIAVVSDGVGSKPHADHGSKVACISTVEALKQWHLCPSASIEATLRLLHALWCMHTAPYSPQDCSATCLFAVRTAELIIAARLGDGLIACCGNTPSETVLLEESKTGSFSGFTHCLHMNSRPEDWQIVSLDASQYSGIVLCTDGISDDITPERRSDFAYSLCADSAVNKASLLKKTVRRQLKNWPVPGHSDDKTLVCLAKKGSSHED
ncbi:PP2C family serine/threonine-protein phosphatase [Mailhella sp.]